MSLRLRLFAMGALVALVAVLAVWLAAHRRVEHEFRQFLERDDHVRFAQLADEVRLRVHAGESPAQVRGAIARGAAGLRGAVAWIDPDGRFVVATDSALAHARFEFGERGEVRVTRTTRDPQGLEHAETFAWVGIPRAPLAGPDGTPAGTLWSFPPMPAAPVAGGGERGFETGVAEGLVQAGLIGLAAALLLSLVLGHAITRSLSDLTAATRKVAAGDRAHRVPVRGPAEIATLARSFNALVESIERGETVRRNMVTDVAHELRTPVTNLRAQVEALEDGLLAPTPEALASLREEIVHLSALIGELQELSLAEAGALALAREPVDVARAAASATSAAQARAHAAGVTLASDVPALPPVLADPARLAQVLRNLLDNALRHTPKGGAVTVGARALGDRAEISVADTGEGIDPAQLPLVFERFHRADPSRDRRSGGAGLGLAVVRRLVEAQGGEARVESAPGQGTTVRFTLPFVAPSSQDLHSPPVA